MNMNMNMNANMNANVDDNMAFTNFAMTTEQFDHIVESNAATRRPFMMNIFVTPILAKHILDRRSNAENRVIRHSKVNEHRKSFEEKRWMPTASIVHINWNGIMDDAHHRMTALSLADTNGANMTFLFNTNPQDFEVIDIGVKRTNADRTSTSRWFIGAANDIIQKSHGTDFQGDISLLNNFKESVDAQVWTRIHEVSKTTRKPITVGSGKSAMLYAIASERCSEEYATLVFRIMTKSETHNFTSAWHHAFNRKINTNRYSAGSRSKERYAEMVFLFDEKYKDRTNYLTGAPLKAYIEEVNSEMEKWAYSVVDGRRKA